jgi:subfamily B ATP-binding cassette protein MsbA
MKPQSSPLSTSPETRSKISVTALRRLLRLALPHRGRLLFAGILMLVSTGISLSLPLAARGALDRVLKTHNVATLDHLALLLVALIVVGALFSYAQYLVMAHAGNRIVQEMRARLFAHLQRLPVAFFDRTRSGDLTSLLSNDVSLLQQTLTEDLVRLAGNIVTLVGGIALAVVIDWRLTVVVVGLLLCVVLMFMVMGRRLRKMTRASLDALSDAMGGINEALSNIRLVKAFAREAHEDRRTGDKLETVFQLSMKSSRLEGAFGTIAFAGFILVLLGVVWYGGRNVMNGTLSAGSLLAFLMTVTIISGPMSSIAIQFSRLQRAMGASDRLFALLDDAPEPADAPNAGAFPEIAGTVAFDNVVFGYSDDVPVLRGLSLELPAGLVTACVGASGAGKTTLAMLLYRFYEPQSGQITIDSVPVTAIKRLALREHIGIVPQEPILFNGTIRDNIRYGKLTATDAEIEAAARAANVEEFVLPLEKGYETILGERGITLSGGQRQRVAIARAVLKDPRLLILDEATSALDTRSEMLVREALERLMRGRTTLVIAHRLSTIQNADQIVVLHGGEVVERGTHAELLETAGRYADLHGLLHNPLLETADLDTEAVVSGPVR